MTRQYHISGKWRPRISRAVIAVLMVMAYVFTASFHGLCDLEMTASGQAGAVVAMSVSKDKDIDSKGKIAVAAQHCHGCFSVVVSSAPRVLPNLPPCELPEAVAHLTTLAFGTDTPPPKDLL